MLKIPDIIHVQSNKNTEKYLTHQELNIEAEPRFLSKFTYLKDFRNTIGAVQY